MKYYKINKKDSLGGGQEWGVEKMIKKVQEGIKQDKLVRGTLFHLRTDDRM